MSDNQCLALLTGILHSTHDCSVEISARTAVAIGELFGVFANENTKMELLLGGNAFEQPVTEREADDCVEATL